MDGRKNSKSFEAKKAQLEAARLRKADLQAELLAAQRVEAEERRMAAAALRQARRNAP